MSRRTKVWIGSAATVTVSLALVLTWPRPDRYAYLRFLHPKTSYYEGLGWSGGTKPAMELDFSCHPREVRDVLLTHGAIPFEDDGFRYIKFTMPTGQYGLLEQQAGGSSLLIFDETEPIVAKWLGRISQLFHRID
ncbi:MAG TPA: hypothetical protein VHE55_11690 [Fimbriimonadaceae bacterium]|nr:hypothetical protein [Fimbriimonadaceae bacterium]